MNVFAYLSFFATVIFVVLGEIVITRDPRNWQNRLFLGFMASLALWSFGDFILRIAGSETIALWANLLSGLGWSVAGGLFVLFALEFSGRRRLLKPSTFAIIFLPGLFFLSLLWTTGLVTDGYVLGSWGYYATPGPLYVPSQIYVLVLFALGVVILFRYFRASRSQRRRTEAFYILAATLVPMAFGIVTGIVLPVTGSQAAGIYLFVAAIMGVIVLFGIVRAGALIRIAPALGSAVISIMKDAVFIVDSGDIIETVNAAALTMTGCREFELEGRALSEVLFDPPGDSALGSSIDDGGPQELKYCRSEHGGEFPVAVSAGSIVSRAGGTIGKVLTARDMRETLRLVQAEKELKAADAEARAEREHAEVLQDALNRLAEAERELAEEKALTDNALDVMIDAFAVTDLEGRILKWNRALERVSGFDESEIPSMRIWDRILEDDMPLFLDALANLLNDGHTAVEVRMVSNDGTTVYQELAASVIRDTNGNPKGICGVARDITGKKVADEELAREKAFTESALDALPDAFYAVDPEGKFARWNRAVLEASGYSDEEIRRLSPLDFIATEDREDVGRAIDEVMRTGVRKQVAVDALTKDGRRIPYEFYGAVIKDQNGITQGLCGIGRDITERMEAERALRESEEMYRTLVETSPDGIWVTDRYGSIIAASNRSLELFGMEEADELTGKTCIEMTHASDRDKALLFYNRLLEKGVLRDSETRMLRKDGSHFTANTSASIIRDRNGMPWRIVNIVRNVTERKRVQDEIIRLSRQVIEEQEQALKKMAQDLHDDIGQSLNTVKLQVGLLEKEAPYVHGRRSELMRDVTEGLQRTIDKVRDISGELRPLLLEDFGLEKALSHHLMEYRNATGIKFMLDTDGFSGGLPKDYELPVFRIVQESVSNALKHADARDIRVRLRDKGPDLIVSIEDDGHGFSLVEALEADKLKPHFGILTMRERAKMLGGDLAVDSRPGSGTTVILTIPLG